MRRTLLVTPLIIGLMCGGRFAPASAQDDDIESLDRTPQDCVLLNRVRRTEVIDDRTILFHLRGGGVLRNYLQDDCPNLEREDRFSYRTSNRQLCRIDTITVIERSGFSGFTCRLGPFYPMSPEELVELREGRAPIESSPVEVPDDEE